MFKKYNKHSGKTKEDFGKKYDQRSKRKYWKKFKE